MDWRKLFNNPPPVDKQPAIEQSAYTEPGSVPDDKATDEVSKPESAPKPVSGGKKPDSISQFRLGDSIVSKGDLSRAIRELESIDAAFHQKSLGRDGVEPGSVLSASLNGVFAVNNLAFKDATDRKDLKEFLVRAKVKAPVINISFPSEASDTVVLKLLNWFRSDVNQLTLMNVGLQPNLVAGCIVRTTNKIFDFSFRKRFADSKEKLMESLSVSMKDAPVSSKATDTEAVSTKDDSGVPVAPVAESTQAEIQTEPKASSAEVASVSTEGKVGEPE